MDPRRAVTEVSEVIPRFVERSLAQAEFVRALLQKLGCSAISNPGVVSDSVGDSAAEDSGSAQPGDATTEMPSGEEEPEEAPVAEAPVASDLAIPSYESLAAAQVVPRLASLSADELESVRAFERAHRQRRTILNRVEQLLEG